jgi:hypothetical protein
MVSLDARSPRLLVGALAALLVVAACGSSAEATASPTVSPTPSPTAVPTPRPTPRPIPTPIPTPTPSPTPTVTATLAEQAAAALKIGAPYKLVANPANAALSGAVSMDIAGQHVNETIAGREIWQGSKPVGLVLVLEIEGVQMSPKVFEGGAQGAANNTGGKLSYTTILGHRVALVTAKAGTFGMYALHDTIVMVLATKPADTKPLLTSVIKANQ